MRRIKSLIEKIKLKTRWIKWIAEKVRLINFSLCFSFILIFITTFFAIYLIWIHNDFNLKKLWFLWLFLPSILFTTSILWRCFCKYRFNIYFKNSYLENKDELINKIKEDYKKIIENKSISFFSSFGSGKSYYLKMLTYYITYKKGTIFIFYNFWWNSSSTMTDFLKLNISFTILGITIPLQKMKIMYFIVIPLLIIDLITRIILKIIKIIWTFGSSKSLIWIIDEPERGENSEKIEPILNQMRERNVSYIVMQSSFFVHEDKIIDCKLQLPEYNFGKANLRYVASVLKEKKTFIDSINKSFLSNIDDSLKNKFSNIFIGAKAKENENSFILNHLRSKLLKEGKELRDYKLNKGNGLLGSANFIGSSRDFLWNFDWKKIISDLKGQLSKTEIIQINDFIKNQYTISDNLPENKELNDEYFWNLWHKNFSVSSYFETKLFIEIKDDDLKKYLTKINELFINWYDEKSTTKSISNIYMISKIIVYFEMLFSTFNFKKILNFPKSNLKIYKKKLRNILKEFKDKYSNILGKIIENNCAAINSGNNAPLNAYFATKKTIDIMKEERYFFFNNLSEEEIDSIAIDFNHLTFKEQILILRKITFDKGKISNISDQDIDGTLHFLKKMNLKKPDGQIEIFYYKNMKESLSKIKDKDSFVEVFSNNYIY